MASAKFSLYQEYYTSNKWTKKMLHKAVERGHITQEEYLTLTGEEYVPIIYKYEGGNLTDLVEKNLITGDPDASSNTSGSNENSGGTEEEPEDGNATGYVPPPNTGGVGADPEDENGGE